jgi:copper chaperone
MEFNVKVMRGHDDVQVITRGIHTVDPDANVDVDIDARTVKVDSWLLAEEFLVAFNEDGYEVRITKG